ncbi:metallophosphoesterase [Candidatus Sumerlaeota bacterium]|nr:metallophosphoesterase [Candidatus Sumerlaeota bacterium]
MKSEWRTWSFAAGVILCLGAVESAAPTSSESPMFVGPYLQNPARDAMTICFVARNISNAKVELKKSGTTNMQTFPAKPLAIPDTSWTTWRTRLDNLKPDYDYEYLVKYRHENAEHSTKTYRLHTFNSQVIKAIILNDLHDRIPTAEALMQHCKPDDYDFSALLGDCWENPGHADRTIEILDHYIRLLNAGEKPMLFLRGNHEYRGSFANDIGYLFDLPYLDPTAPIGKQEYYFSLHAGPVWFLVLDTGEDFEKMYDVMQPYRKREAEWIKTLSENNDSGNSRWHVMLSHIPLYNDNIWNSEPSRQMWEPILPTLHIDVALAGHDHGYKFLEKGKTLKVTHDPQYTDNRGEWEMTPPYPVIIGGGPELNKATLMILEADRNALRIRMIKAVNGSVVKEFNLHRK